MMQRPHSVAMLRKVIMVLAIGCIALLSVPLVASAEGRCPPGSYPIGGQGVGGCAPIASGGGAPQEARPTGRWIKTWGAIATSSTGEVGVAIEKLSKSDAAKEAVSQCVKLGGRDCKMAQAYKNQCIALISPTTSERGGSVISSAETEQVATQLAMKTCTTRGSAGCSKLYSACTKPLFESF